MTAVTTDSLETLVVREDHGGFVRLRLNRPAQFNALSEGMLDALHAELDAVRKMPSVRAVVLEAAGKAFCAGHDLREMRATPKLETYQSLFTRCSKVMMAIQELPVPVIARVHGVATAAGCQLVASCDLAVASSAAKFAVSGINVGLFCSTPSVALSRNVGTKNAFDMLVTGRFIEATTAREWGLINEVADPDQLDTAVLRYVEQIAGKSPAAIRYGKEMFYRQRRLSLPEAYAYASDVMARNMMEEDAAEGVDAFLQKRPPVWRS